MQKINIFILSVLLIFSNYSHSMLLRCLKSPRPLKQKRYCAKHRLFILPEHNLFNTMPTDKTRDHFLEDLYDRNNSHIKILHKTIQLMRKQIACADASLKTQKVNQNEFRKLEEQISINLNTVCYNLYYDLPPQQLLDRD